MAIGLNLCRAVWIPACFEDRNRKEMTHFKISLSGLVFFLFFFFGFGFLNELTHGSSECGSTCKKGFGADNHSDDIF